MRHSIRRKIELAAGIAILAGSGICAWGQASYPPPNDLPNPYRTVTGWAQLPVQYVDYTLWHQGLLGAESDPDSVAARQLRYWQRELANLPEITSLPPDRARPPVPSYRGEEVDLRIDPHNRYILLILEKIANLDEHRLRELRAGTLFYAALFLVEGTGLALRQRWAEYVTIISTGSLIPLEVYELVKQYSPLKIAFLLINIAVVVYLIFELRRNRH